MGEERKREIEDRRSEPRLEEGRFHSVEINLGAPLPIYQFNLRDVSEKGVCILVRENSPILKRIKVDQELDLKFYATDESKANIVKQMKTRIRHITKGTPGHYSGHCLVGVSVLDESETKEA